MQEDLEVVLLESIPVGREGNKAEQKDKVSCCAVRIKQSHKVLSNLHGGLKLIRSFQIFGRDLRHPVTGCWLFLKQGWGGAEPEAR